MYILQNVPVFISVDVDVDVDVGVDGYGKHQSQICWHITETSHKVELSSELIGALVLHNALEV